MAEGQENKPTIRIKSDQFKKICNSGTLLFFFNFRKEWNSSRRDYDCFWEAENSAIVTKIYKIENIQHKINDIFLLYIKPLPQSLNYSTTEYINVEYEEFNPSNFDHVKSIFLTHISQRNDPNDKYACRDLLWYLNNYFLDSNILKSVIDSFDSLSVKPFLLQELSKLSLCLSLPKQELIQSILKTYNINSQIYFPQLLKDALELLYPNLNPYQEWYRNIFDLVYKTLFNTDKPEETGYDITKQDNITNFFLQIRRWLIDENYVFTDFDQLTRMLRLYPSSTQLLLLKRYFVAILKGQTDFDINVLKKFKDNKFDNWGIYQYSVNRASKPVELGLQLLCDNILTFLSTGGKTLQTINGTLDLAFYQCNISHPNVDFQLSNIVPVCDGGAVQNKSGFRGFICYQIIHIFKDEIYDNKDSLMNLIFRIFDSLSTFCHTHKECNSDNNKLNSVIQKLQICRSCNNFKEIKLRKWNFNKPSADKCKIINIFLKSNFISTDKVIDINEEDIIEDLNLLQANIKNFIDSILPVIPDKNNFKKGYKIPYIKESEINLLLNNILAPSWVIVEPRHNAYLDLGLLSSKINVPIQDYYNNRALKDDIKQKEAEYLQVEVINSLKNDLKIHPDENGKFYIPYNPEVLRNLQAKFYTNYSFDNGNDFRDKNLNFLERIHSIYIRYCAPEYTDDKNHAINLPYYWCRGNECYKNSLSEQTIGTCKSWNEYNIFHLLEILGHSQIKKTEAGYEPTKLIRDFIGIVNKASQMFKRVICRECGHILFPIYRSSFNQYNYFECYNPVCIQRNQKVYLSQCHHCKSGLIDSRDSKQCPNGWRICPTCLSCCTDELLEFRAQKYIRKGQSIPYKLQITLGHGHNNQNQYFCPYCGGTVVKQFDKERNETFIYCGVCHTNFPKAKSWI